MLKWILSKFKGKPKKEFVIQFVVYDIPNENVSFVDKTSELLTEQELRENKILMPAWQAAAIRKAKGLPMPCPPVEVSLGKQKEGEPYIPF